MRYDITNTTKDDSVNSQIESVLDREMRPLDRLLTTFPQEEVMLRIVADDGKPVGVDISLRLSLPGRMLTSSATSTDVRAALDQAVSQLRRQLVDYKDQLQRRG
jgi:ribosomal subunit interface protein